MHYGIPFARWSPQSTTQSAQRAVKFSDPLTTLAKYWPEKEF